MTRRMKAALVTVFALLLAVVLVTAGLSFVGNANWMSNGFSRQLFASVPVLGPWNQLYEKKIDRSFTVADHKPIFFASSLGDVTVSQGAGKRVEVLTTAGFGGFSATSAEAQARLYQLNAVDTPTGLHLSLGNSAGISGLHKVAIQLIVPVHAALQVVESMGNVNVSGDFKTLQVQDNMGNINVNGNVANSMTLGDDMGNIFYQGDPGQSSRMTNNMGNVAIFLVGKRALQVAATTDLGNISGELGQFSVQTAHHWSGSTGSAKGATKAGSMSVYDHLGNITINEVNNG